MSAVVWRAPGSRELLLMQRSDNGHWCLPGGHVEPGESVPRRRAREVREETGFEVELGRLVGVYSDPGFRWCSRADGRRVHYVNLCFEALRVGQPGAARHARRDARRRLLRARRAPGAVRADPPRSASATPSRATRCASASEKGGSHEAANDEVHLRDGRRALVARQGARVGEPRRAARGARPARHVPEARSVPERRSRAR